MDYFNFTLILTRLMNWSTADHLIEATESMMPFTRQKALIGAKCLSDKENDEKCIKNALKFYKEGKKHA